MGQSEPFSWAHEAVLSTSLLFYPCTHLALVHCGPALICALAEVFCCLLSHHPWVYKDKSGQIERWEVKWGLGMAIINLRYKQSVWLCCCCISITPTYAFLACIAGSRGVQTTFLLLDDPLLHVNADQFNQKRPLSKGGDKLKEKPVT